MLPEEERIERQKAYWNTFVALRNTHKNKNNNNTLEKENIHEYTNRNLDNY